MRTPASNQIAKQKAVAEARGRRKVFITSRRFRGDGLPITRVLVSGRYYDVGDLLLRQLLSGVTPRELELDPAPDEADPGHDPANPGIPASLVRSGRYPGRTG